MNSLLVMRICPFTSDLCEHTVFTYNTKNSLTILLASEVPQFCCFFLPPCLLPLSLTALFAAGYIPQQKAVPFSFNSLLIAWPVFCQSITFCYCAICISSHFSFLLSLPSAPASCSFLPCKWPSVVALFQQKVSFLLGHYRGYCHSAYQHKNGLAVRGHSAFSGYSLLFVGIFSLVTVHLEIRINWLLFILSYFYLFMYYNVYSSAESSPRL